MDNEDIIVQMQNNMRQRAQGNVVTAPEYKPDDAARAFELEKSSGTPAPAILPDLENFDRDYGVKLGNEIVNNNEYLQNYINAHPLHASLSQDDLGTLDNISKNIQKFGATSVTGKAFEGFKSFMQADANVTEAVGKRATEAFKHAFDPDLFVAEYPKLVEYLANNPIFGNLFIRQATVASLVAAAGSMRLFPGLLAGASAGLGEVYHQLGGSEAQANRITRDAFIFAQVALSGQAGFHLHPKVAAQIKEATNAWQSVEPYAKAGIDPPAGLHPFIDQIKLEQTKRDLEIWDDALKDSEASKTRERSAEVFSSFLRQHPDHKIGIRADAVAELYKEKPPAPDDNILGWIPNLAEQLDAALPHGGTVEVPLSLWLTHVDREVAKQLHDDLVTRPGGVTLNEGKVIGKAVQELAMREEPVADQAVESVRKAAALDPLFGERKLTLKRLGTKETGLHFPPEVALEKGVRFHDFTLNDAQDRVRVVLNVSEHAEGKKLYIEDIHGMKSFHPNDFGPAQMRDALRQLKAEFPNAEEVTGFRVSGAREKSGAWESKGLVTIKLDDAGIQEAVKRLEGGEWLDYGEKTSAYIRPRDLLTSKEKEVVAVTEAELKRIAPKQASFQEADVIKQGKQSVLGVHAVYDDMHPIILWALDHPDSAFHEVMHHLREQGFWADQEYATIRKAALGNKWIEKYDINTRYPNLSTFDKVDEAIAEGFRQWKVDKKSADGILAKAFEKLDELYQAIKFRLKEIFGREVTWEELFRAADRGDIGSREGNKPRNKAAFRYSRDEPELPGLTRIEDRAPFAPGAITRSKEYMAHIEQRKQEDLARLEKIYQEEERKRQTREWKENEKVVRTQVEEEITNRPDIAADQMLRDGYLYGEKLSSKPKLAADALTEQQRAALPKEFIAKEGLHPDDVAGLFGYQSGTALVDKMIELNQARGEVKPKDYLKQLVAQETEQRMQRQFGKLDENILREAKDHALSEVQENILHEEVLELAIRGNLEFTITQADFRSQVLKRFRNTPMSEVSVDNLLANVGRAGREAEAAFLKEDWAEAFRLKQRQEIGVIMAREAKKVEKAREQFERTAKRFSAREVANVSPEYTNAVHDVLMRVGQPVKRSIQDLGEAFQRDGYNTFDNFVSSKEADLRELHVPDFLRDPNFRKPIDQMSVEEFGLVNDAVKALVFNGRDELKLERAGEKADLLEVLDQMKEQIASLGPPKDYRIDQPVRKGVEWGKSWWWSGITVESMLNRLDRDNPNGIFNQYIIRPFTQASNYKDRLIREYQKKISELGKIEGMDNKIENTLFIDPITNEPIPMRRRNVLGILQNAGNAGNISKLAKGYNLEPQQVMDWLHRHTTKEDWDRAQRIGDLFNEIFEKANVMSHNISGVGIQKVPIEPLQTPFGTYAGWYNPIKYDSIRPGGSRTLLGQSVEQEGFYRATTPQGYTEQRTGYIAPMELNLDIVPIRMKQMLHDIAMRPAVIQLSKVFYHPSFKREMINHYGRHQAEEMIPFLRDIANASNFKSLSESLGGEALEFFRQNTIATLIGFNPGTVMKHGTTALFNSMTEVGMANFGREFRKIISDAPQDRRNWTMAMEKSEELQRRMRNFQELVSGHGSEINIRGAQTKFDSYREFMMSAGATPVSISDLLSAVPTWLAKYKNAIANGENEGQAVFLADRAVRRAHGSSVISNKPAIMRTGGLASFFSSLYGFFSHMQQKQYELAWKARDLIKDTTGKGSGDIEPTTRHIPDLLRGFMSYIVIPAAIEEIVTPYTNSEKDSWGMKAAKALGMGVSSSFIGVRDFTRAFINLRDPQAGLIGTTLKAGTDLGRDLSHGKQAFTKDKAGNLIKHTFALTGVLTGLTNAQEGKALEYLYRYYQGMEKPKGPWDVSVGLRFGKTDKHSRSFEQWLKH